MLAEGLSVDRRGAAEEGLLMEEPLAILEVFSC